MSTTYAIVCLIRPSKGQPYRWRCHPLRIFKSEQEARAVYDATELNRLTRIKVLVKRENGEDNIVDSHGWHMDASTVAMKAKRTIAQRPRS